MTERGSAIPAAAQEAAERGDLIGAIKITRAQTGLALSEAKDAVESHVRARRGEPYLPGSGIPVAAVASLQEGKLIQAIRQTRESRGWGLKESRDAVDNYLASHPQAREQHLAAAKRQDSGLGRVVTVVLIALAVLLLFWLFGK